MTEEKKPTIKVTAAKTGFKFPSTVTFGSVAEGEEDLVFRLPCQFKHMVRSEFMGLRGKRTEMQNAVYQIPNITSERIPEELIKADIAWLRLFMEGWDESLVDLYGESKFTDEVIKTMMEIYPSFPEAAFDTYIGAMYGGVRKNG